MDNYKQVWKNIDYKFLGVLAIVILSPFIYSWIRMFWIVDSDDISLSLTHFQNYLGMFMEIATAFLLVPLFTFSKEEHKKVDGSVFIIITIILGVFIAGGMLFSEALINPMAELNPETSNSEIRAYLYFETISSSLIIFEQFLLIDILVNKKKSKALFFAMTSICLKTTLDVFMLSPIAFIDPTIVSVSVSSTISTFIICLILSFEYISTRWSEWKNKKIDWAMSKKYFVRGSIPGVELLIRNLAYSFVTLQAVLMLGEVEWNAWNMGGYIYWMIVFKITSIVNYYLLSTTIENKDTKELFITSLLVEYLIVIFLGIMLSLTYLPSLGKEEDWKSLAIKLSLANLPVMLLITTQNVLRIKIITFNKYWYMLVSTIVTFFVLQLPLIIIIYGTNLTIGLWMNYLIFAISCLIPTSINVGQYYWILRKGYNNG